MRSYLVSSALPSSIIVKFPGILRCNEIKNRHLEVLERKNKRWNQEENNDIMLLAYQLITSGSWLAGWCLLPETIYAMNWVSETWGGRKRFWFLSALNSGELLVHVYGCTLPSVDLWLVNCSFPLLLLLHYCCCPTDKNLLLSELS